MDRRLLTQLRKIMGKDRVFARLEERVCYSYDATPFREVPELVVMPRCEEEVIKAVRFAREHGMVITPRGAGTGMSGGAVPSEESMVIGSEKLNRIVEINVEERYAIVEPGVLTGDLQEQVLELGLFYPPDPSSYLVSTLGGNVAEGAGGLRCAKYGVTKDYCIGLRVVMAFGDVMATGVLDSQGTLPDMTPLFVGSEGILGYITAIAVRLIDAPESARTMLAFFPEATDAAGAVTGVLASRLLPSVMEFLDRATLQAITGYVPLDIPDDAKAMLLVEVDGWEEEVGGEFQKVIEECREHGGFGIEEAVDVKERERLWQFRRSVSPSLARLASGKINEDVCVPRGEMLLLVDWCQTLSEEVGLQIPVYGHVADGNLHVNVMYDKSDPGQENLAHDTVERILKKTLELGGTLSGEHGIGRTKRRYLHLQFDDEALKIFGKVKQALDPEGLFNPGVMIPE